MKSIIKDKLEQDPTIASLLRTMPLPSPQVKEDIYLVLLNAIVSQQLSVKAAATIWERFLEIFPDRNPAPEIILRIEDQMMRNCGLSYQKAGYIRNIAHFSLNHSLTSEHLSQMDDAQVIEYVSQIKGVGKWTVEMILMFALGRPNVFPIDDLGIRSAMIKLYDIQTIGKIQRAEMESIASNWAPYRSYVCMLLWNWKDK